MKEKKRIRKKIGVGSALKSKVGDIEENTREGRIRSMRKEVVVCVPSPRKMRTTKIFDYVGLIIYYLRNRRMGC